jgi:hypothetical protein
MRSLLLFFGLILSALVGAQPWQWSHQLGGIGDQRATIAAVDASGAVYVHGTFLRHYEGEPYNLYIGGDTLDGSDGGQFFAKYDASGTVQWVRSTIGAGVSNCTIDTVTGLLYIVGTHLSTFTLDTVTVSGNGGFYLSCWNSDGHCLWARSVAIVPGSLFGLWGDLSAVAVDQHGHVLVGGYTGSTGPCFLGGRPIPTSAYLAAYTADGDTLWTRVIATLNGPDVKLSPLEMKTYGDKAYVYCEVAMMNNSDTLVVDTTDITDVYGRAYGLLRAGIDGESIDWFRVGGWPYGSANRLLPHCLYVDEAEQVSVIGGFASEVYFGSDTLVSSTGSSYLASYSSEGELEQLTQYDATGSAFFIGLDATDGGFVVTGQLTGSANWNGHTASANDRSLFMASISNTGECTALEAGIASAYGNSIAVTDDGLYVTGLFPPSTEGPPPFAPITIGGTTYTTYGWQDAFLAKHAPLTSIPAPFGGSEGLVIYANPNQGSFRLQLPDAFSTDRDVLMRIYDSTGHLVLERPLNATALPDGVDVFDAAPGLYRVILTNGRQTCSGGMVVE